MRYSLSTFLLGLALLVGCVNRVPDSASRPPSVPPPSAPIPNALSGGASPDGRYKVTFLADHNTNGNCAFSSAYLVDSNSKMKLFAFTPLDDCGGFEADSVVWSPDSRRVGVYSHHHRSGQPQIVVVDGATVREQTFPEVNLPHESDPSCDGRPAQRWIKPVRWNSTSEILVDASGIVQQQRGVDAILRYGYSILVHFPANGDGEVVSTKRIEFQKDDAWKTE